MYLVHPILNDRMTHSMFVTLYPKLRQHEKKFFNYFRMSVKSFDDLLLLIKEDLSPRKKLCPARGCCFSGRKTRDNFKVSNVLLMYYTNTTF